MINLITPLYRYSNIPIVYSTIIHQLTDFKWHLIEGSNKIDNYDLSFLNDDKRVIRYKIDTYHVWGHEQRNYFIDNISANDNDWCYFLDDDNIVSNDLSEISQSNEYIDYDFILFSQKAGLTKRDRLFGKSSNNLSMGAVDIGSFLIKFSLIKKTRIPSVENRNSDGVYGEGMKQFLNTHKFKFIPDKFVTYNALSLIII